MHSNETLSRDELIALAANDLSLNNIEKALIKLKLAVSLSNEVDIATSLLAKIYAQLKLSGKAIALFQRFIEHHPNAVQERFELGMATLDGGDPLGSLTVWAPLLVDAQHPPALFYSAVAHVELKDFNAARRQLDILLMAIPVDNFYFERAKELLDSLKSSTSNKISNLDIHLNS